VRIAIRIAALLALAIGATGVRADEPPPRDGDVYLTYSNDDLQGDRFGTELLWVQPVATWLDAQIGGHYAKFDDATWGHAIVGAHAWLPFDLGHLTLRYEGGAGDGDATGSYSHHIGDVGWTIPAWQKLLYVDTGLKLIRVDEVDEDLARIGFTVVPAAWLSLNGGYQHSTRRWDNGTEVWTARGDLTWRSSVFFAGYTRSQDSLDLSSIGRGTVLNDPTNEYFVGTTLPIGRHGLTIAGSRFEGTHGDTRHTISLTWRWSLARAPWDFSGEPEPPAGPVPGAGPPTP
jgi:hypothetical protein